MVNIKVLLSIAVIIGVAAVVPVRGQSGRATGSELTAEDRVEIQDLVTRYAHASRLNVKAGDLFIRGQRIATVGTTGRSTGPHLHFEVRLFGVPQNPARFLQAAG